MVSFAWIFVFVNLFGVCEAQTYDSVTNLRSTLLTSYNTDVLPIEDQTGTLNMNLTTYVFMISEVDQLQGAVTMGVMISMEWYDERMTWTPGAHSGLTSISIKSEDVWTPPLTVANPVKFTMLDKSWIQVMYQNDGKATYIVGEVVTFSCSFYMKFWPFDKQVCSLQFFVYGYPFTRITLSVPGTVVNTDYYSENGEWYLDENSFEYKSENFFGASLIKYTFKMDRLPAFYLLTVILPVNGLGALTCLVFLLPSESGERVSYVITIMLSLAVFLTVAAMDLPKNSEPIPVLCLFILFNMVVCIVALVVVILNLVLFHRNDKVPIGRVYKKLLRYSHCRWSENKIQQVNNQRRSDQLDEKAHEERPRSTMTTRKILVTPHNFVADESGRDSNTDDETTWQEISRAIDKISFVASVVLTYIPSLIILIFISAASNYEEQ